MRLCSFHFIDFFERKVFDFIRKFKLIKRGESVLVAFSGGKDSLACLLSLRSIADEHGFNVSAYHIDLGINGYSYTMRKYVEEICGELGVTLHLTDLKEKYGFTVEEASKKRKRPVCSVCGIVKRYLMNRETRELGYNKLATGHNMDDMIEFAFKNWLNQEFEWLAKQKPLLPQLHPKVTPKIKPLFERTEKENAAYVTLKGFEYPLNECPNTYLSGWKEVASKIEEMKTGFKLMFIKSLEKFSYPLRQGDFKVCSLCGEPSSSEICAFCKVKTAKI